MVKLNSELLDLKESVCTDDPDISQEYANAMGEDRQVLQDKINNITRAHPNNANQLLDDTNFNLRRQMIHLELKSIGWDGKLTGEEKRSLVHLCQLCRGDSLEELRGSVKNRADIQSFKRGRHWVVDYPGQSAILNFFTALDECEKIRKTGKRVPVTKIKFKENLKKYHMDHLHQDLQPKFPDHTNKVLLKQEDTKCLLPEFDIRLEPWHEKNFSKNKKKKGGKNNIVKESTLSLVAEGFDESLGTSSTSAAVENAALKKATEVLGTSLPCAQYMIALRRLLGTFALVGTFGDLGYKVVDNYIGLLERLAARVGVPMMTVYDETFRDSLADNQKTKAELAKAFCSIDDDILNDMVLDDCLETNQETRATSAENKKEIAKAQQALKNQNGGGKGLNNKGDNNNANKGANNNNNRERDHLNRANPQHQLFSNPNGARGGPGKGGKGGRQ